MPIYSHSQLSVYEQCPFRYKLHYRDNIRREAEQGIEAFVGDMVHQTLKKCYDDIRLTRLNTLDELLSCYDNLWQKNWSDGIVITKKDMTQEHYRAHGKRMLEGYYKRYAPFNQDKTVGTEVRFHFSLDSASKYRMMGYIDRLSSAGNNTFEIHDYKTGARLPTQEEAARDRQLGLYQIGVQNKWPSTKNIKLVWHYLAFDAELVSLRSRQSISQLVEETKKLIDEIESATEFPSKETIYCDWCEYPDLCPHRKHLYMVEELPAAEYLADAGVALVNKYTELKDEADKIGQEMGHVREAIVEFARKEGLAVVQGSKRFARVKIERKLKFPIKKDEGREELESIIQKSGMWMEVSDLNTTALARSIQEKQWDEDLVDKVMEFGRIEETSSVVLSKKKEDDVE